MMSLRTRQLAASIGFAALLGGCAAQQGPAIHGLPPVAVTADGETAPVGTAKALSLIHI